MMQAPSGSFSPQRSLKAGDWLLLGVAMVCIALSVAVILAGPGTPSAWPMDQSFVSTADIRIWRSDGNWVFQYPYLQHSGGITSSLIAGIYKLIIPTTENSVNWHIKILGMIGFLVSSLFLLKTFVPGQPARILAFLIISCSGYQFIEPTSELFAATLFNLFLVAAYRNWNPILSSGLLAGFGLCKVELLLAAIVIAMYWAYGWSRRNRQLSKSITLWFIGWLAVFLFPGFVVHGLESVSGTRSLIAFDQHYGMLFSPHQFTQNWQTEYSGEMQFVKNIFGNAQSIQEVVLRHPRQYLDFLALSALQSIINVGETLKFLALPVLVLLWRRQWPSELRFPLIVLTLALVFTLLPAWLFAFVHIRYLSRYFPAIVVMITAGCLYSSGASATTMKRLLWVSGLITFLWQISSISTVINNAHFL
jgi:hypothetical protein